MLNLSSGPIEKIILRRADGHPYNLVSLKPTDLPIEVLAYNLAKICRFGGNIPWPYSVATHSVLVSLLLPEKEQYAGLMHDLAEGSGLNDQCSPVKKLEKDYCRIEDWVQCQLSKMYSFPAVKSLSVDYADHLAGEVESYFLRGTAKPSGMTEKIALIAEPLCSAEIPWRGAAEMFLDHYRYQMAVRGFH